MSRLVIVILLITVSSPLKVSIAWKNMAAFLFSITILIVGPGKEFYWVISHSMYLLFLCPPYSIRILPIQPVRF
jgi:hypothetical protein